MQQFRILWADDEIDLLKPHVLFLTSKGYEVETVTNGQDAISMLDERSFDLVFLDENMPGISGLETLSRIKSMHPGLPVVMITKSEEEHIMEEAIGSKIADYLIKPLNPNQILLSVKKLLDNQRIVSERTNINYQQEFTTISMEVQDAFDHESWADIYKKLVFWELEIDSTEEKSMSEILLTQKGEANSGFSKFIRDHYEDWLKRRDTAPLLSDEVLSRSVFPLIGEDPVILIVIDNLRWDQWETIEPEISRLFDIVEKSHYYSILPTTTAYARNALFSGMMPLEIERQHPEYWIGESEEGSRNKFEAELLQKNLERNQINIQSYYHKIIQAKDGKVVLENVDNLLNQSFSALVYNFVDMLSHSRTDLQMIRELAPDESAYRALTSTWFSHSSLYETLKKLSEKKLKLVITTDHGTIRVKNPQKIVGDRSTNPNLRYKLGKNLSFDEKRLFFTREPHSYRLPRPNLSSTYVFAQEEDFLAYPNNYNYYVNHYKDTFQHGGVSMEEIIVPLVVMKTK